MWTPISLWIPEHSIQVRMPRLVESHPGSTERERDYCFTKLGLQFTIRFIYSVIWYTMSENNEKCMKCDPKPNVTSPNPIYRRMYHMTDWSTDWLTDITCSSTVTAFVVSWHPSDVVSDGPGQILHAALHTFSPPPPSIQCHIQCLLLTVAEHRDPSEHTNTDVHTQSTFNGCSCSDHKDKHRTKSTALCLTHATHSASSSARKW